MDESKITKPLDESRLNILRDKATEAPFSGEHLYRKDNGEYHCGACGSILFRSNEKFDSSCGWPSFYDIATTGAVELVDDTTHGMHRTEVVCAQCRGHLGHVFDDAPDQPTGLRYCINSLALDFEPKK